MDGPAGHRANVAWARETFDALGPGMAGRSYVNNLTAEDGRKVHEVWGANYRRLVPRRAAGPITDFKELTMHVTSIVNGVDLDRLSGTIDAVTADPALARFQFRAGNHWIDGGHSRTTIQGFYGAGQEDDTRTQPFTVDADEPPVLLGQNRAPNAGEYLLHALAACLTGTIVYHAAARGIALDGLECTIQGDLDLRGFLGLDSSVRPGYEQIQVTIKAAGDFDDNQFAELASLTRYSPVRDIVSNPVPVVIDVARA